MKRALPLLAMSFLLVACDALEGTLNVNQELTLKAKKTGLFQSGTRDIKVPVGPYQAKLNPTSETNINLELTVSGKEQKIPFRIVKGTTLPEVEGQLDILSNESGQNIDLHADVHTEKSSSNFDQNESCVARTIPTQRCQTIPGGRSCRVMPPQEICYGPRNPQINIRNCRMVPGREECVYQPPVTNCWIEQIPVYGSQLVTYEKVVSTRFINIDLIDAGNHVGQFNYQKTTTNNYRQGSSVCQ